MHRSPRITSTAHASFLAGRRGSFVPCVALSLATCLVFALASTAAGHDADRHGGHASPMSEAGMRAQSDTYWSSHARVGSPAPDAKPTRATAAATFAVSNFKFDAGVAGAVDTAKITAGQTVDWVWSGGIHTITNGEGSGDPNMGTIFNQPSDAGNPTFSFTFPNPGTYPFFCVFHEDFNMRGVIVVSAVTGVGNPNGRARLGFTRDPAPNPSSSGVRFEYALATPGHVLAEVFDPTGRRVTVLVDSVRPAGPASAAWDGRTSDGAAATGVFYVRLRLPGFDQSRRVVLRH